MSDPEPADRVSDAIAEYKAAVDRTLLRENLRRTPLERIRTLSRFQRFAVALRKAGEKLRSGEAAGEGGTRP